MKPVFERIAVEKYFSRMSSYYSFTVRFNLSKEYKIDILVEKQIELKSIDSILPVHEAQLISYLKLADKKEWGS
jgi:GxxExxY protein